jgi:hypothetical protein
MMKTGFASLLAGGDLRSTGNSNAIASAISGQAAFDKLFNCLFDKDRLVVMRAADCIEKLTIEQPGYLLKHTAAALDLCARAGNKELLWHLAQLIPRLRYNRAQLVTGWTMVHRLALDKNMSRIVRVNALQAMFELAVQEPSLLPALRQCIRVLEKESIPSLAARVRRIKKNGLLTI